MRALTGFLFVALVATALLWLATSPAPAPAPELPRPSASAKAHAGAVTKIAPLKTTALHETASSITRNDAEPPPAPSAKVVVGLVDGHWISQGDILVDSALVDDSGLDAETRIATLDPIKFWPHARIPQQIDNGVDSDKVLAAIAEFESRTSVRFPEHESESDYLVFRATTDDRCESFLGRKGGEQEVLVGPNCSTGQILHELMHALGFAHEQSRADRDDFLVIHWEAIKPEFHNQFQKLPPELLPIQLGDFDYESILLYPSDAFSIDGRPTITKKNGGLYAANRGHLSALDVKKIASMAKN